MLSSLWLNFPQFSLYLTKLFVTQSFTIASYNEIRQNLSNSVGVSGFENKFLQLITVLVLNERNSTTLSPLIDKHNISCTKRTQCQSYQTMKIKCYRKQNVDRSKTAPCS